MNQSIQALMDESGVKFGTSGARGLVTELTDRIAYAYTCGFLQFLADAGELPASGGPVEVLVGGDLRPSTPRIMEAVLRAAADAGYRPVSCGRIPSPALALLGFARRIPSIMVTGSHIPDDRNGIKFNKCSGEVLKDDEPGITRQVVELPDGLFDAKGAFTTPAPAERPIHGEALAAYVARCTGAFATDALRGLRIGVYQHSAVARDVLADLLRRLGADVVPLGRSDRFIPVDTEAIRDEDVVLARQWAAGGKFDAIVSADGDSDRPLVSDERGEWLRGDVAGILCARFLGADSISTPVSCNTAVEKCGWFPEVRRTRIGSPFVVSSMHAAAAAGAQRVVGYEANGGFLLQSAITLEGRSLAALPTRDAVIVILAVLLLARREGRTISQLAATLPARFTASDRLKEFPTEQSRAILARFSTGHAAADRAALDAVFGPEFGPARDLDRTDGLRVTLASGEILHLRPSGNAPEFRCYTEAATEERARAMNARALAILRQVAGLA
jgi:phosphomannomutase